MKKILCAVLAVVTAIAFAGCEFKSPANVLKVNGKDISSGVYLIYQYLAYSDAANLAENYDKLLKEDIEDVPAMEWIHNKTTEYLKNYIYIENAFNEKGFTFTDEEMESFSKQGADNYENNSKMFSKNGIGYESYFAFYLNSRKDAKLLEDFKSNNPVTDDDIKKYTDETYSHIIRVSFPSKDKDGAALTDEKSAEIETIRKELEAAVNGGKEFTKELAATYVEKALKVAGIEFTENSVDSYFSSSYVGEATSAYYPEDFFAEMMAAEKGKAKISDVLSSKYVWGRVESFPTEQDFEEYKPSITTEIQQKNYEAEIEAGTAAYTIEEDSKAVSFYSAKNCKLA